MPITNFPNGISSMGIPLLGGGALFSGGKAIFLDPANGSDGNTGLEWTSAKATLSSAYALATTGKNDVIYLIGTGQAAGSARLSATFTWAKDATHLIGVGAPTVAGRARIAPTAATTLFTPMMTVSGDGCIFSNINWFHGFATEATAIGCLNVTGERNYFVKCSIQGIGHAEAGDQAASYSLALTGDGENTFEDCVIGLDTIARSTTCAEIDLKTAAVRNRFIRCDVLSYADNAGALFVKADTANDIDRFVMFDSCMFINSGTSAMTAAMNVHATNGLVIIKDSWLAGGSNWNAVDSTVIKMAGNGTSVTGDINVIGLAGSLNVA